MMGSPWLATSDELICHLRALHVEPVRGIPDWRMEARAREEAANGYSFGADELLLVGSYPQLDHVRNAKVREHLRELLEDGRRLKTRSLEAPRETFVSSVQVAAWFDGPQLMVASVGSNPVEIQRWGRGRVPLGRWPGEAAGKLTTLWLPLTEGADGANLRWRIALAYTGPEGVVGEGWSDLAPVAAGAPMPTGVAAGVGLAISELQMNVVVERFQQWLSFPASTYRPARSKVLAQRAAESAPAGRDASRRRDTRLDRLRPLREQLASKIGYSGALDLDFLGALLEVGAVTPADVGTYPEIDLGLLADLGLLPR
jgi:hypothetical protein